MPLLVGYARLYRGMHHLSDIVIGAVNGVICMLLAWNYLRRKTSGAEVERPGTRGRAALTPAAEADTAHRNADRREPLGFPAIGVLPQRRQGGAARLRRRRGGRVRSSRRRRR